MFWGSSRELHNRPTRFGKVVWIEEWRGGIVCNRVASRCRHSVGNVLCFSGSGDKVGAFESRVFSAGPQMGYIFPIAGKQGFLGLKSYFEFGAKDRPEGWNTWLTFAISDAPPTPGAAPPPLVHK
jgi:Putative MetA-pathway of phenol degradation